MDSVRSVFGYGSLYEGRCVVEGDVGEPALLNDEILSGELGAEFGKKLAIFGDSLNFFEDGDGELGDDREDNDRKPVEGRV